MTYNLNRSWDTVNDLAYGLAGALICTLVFRRLRFTKRRRATPGKY